MKKNIGILDIETGGFSTTKNGVCEIALLIVSEDLTEVISEHVWLIKPYTRADDTDELVSYKDDAMEVHGIKLEELEQNGLDVKSVCAGFLSVLQDANVNILMGHNVKAFDIPKVDHLTTRFLNVSLNGYSKICTLELSKRHLSFNSNKLQDLCAELGIIQTESHRALSDCYSTFQLAKVLQERGVFKIE